MIIVIIIIIITKLSTYNQFITIRKKMCKHHKSLPTNILHE